MKTLNFKKIAGIGLIEVLITTVVVAIGLLAIVSLQGTLMGESRENKSRTEAKTLAESKIEELRDAIVKAGDGTFLPAAGADITDTVVGVTESFTRSWTIINQVDPERKEVEVNICWSGGCPLATGIKSNQLAVQGEIIFDNVGNSAKNLKDAQTAGAVIGSPSTNAESSDEITKTKDVADDDPDTLESTTADDDGLFWIRKDSRTKATGAFACAGLGLASFESGLWTRRINFDGVAGSEAIEMFEQQVIDGILLCIPRIRFNGGVIIPIRGTVHSAVNVGNSNSPDYLDVDLFTFNASETGAYCVFNPDPGARSAPYVCYVGGNCTDFSGATDDSNVTKCPDGAFAATKVGSGGWRGKVGLLGVAGANNDFKNVCFKEEIASEPAAGSLSSGRNYFSVQNGINEGINKPYNCHDFLIIAGKPTENKIHEECVDQADDIAGLNLAGKNIARSISGGSNVFDPITDTDSCTEAGGTSFVIIGDIENANSIPNVTIHDDTATSQCTATTTAYNCEITTAADSVTVTGFYNNETVNCDVTPVSINGCTLTFVATNDPVYTINGNILGNTVAAKNGVIVSISGGGSCLNNNNGTYSCSISTSNSSVVLTATIPVVGGSVTPETYTIDDLPGYNDDSLEGPEFSATMSSTYTISGALTLGNGVDGATNFDISVDLDMGSCNITGNSSYSCTVLSGANHLHVTISPFCTTGQGNSPGKQYEISDDDGNTTSGTGILTIDLGTVSGNVIKNISVEKSNTNC